MQQDINLNRRNWLVRGLAVLIIIFLLLGIRNIMTRRTTKVFVTIKVNNTTKPHQNLTKILVNLPKETFKQIAHMNGSDKYEEARKVLKLQLLTEEKDSGGFEVVDEFASTAASPSVTPLTIELKVEEKIKNFTKCLDKYYDFSTVQHGEFIGLQNYIRAEHGSIRCSESVTFVTHGDFTSLDNLIPVLKRWKAPISMAIHAPGTDYSPTIESIQYLRNCLPESDLVRKFVTFHIYFNYRHMPNDVKIAEQILETPFDCNSPPPYATVKQLYKINQNLTYPINVGRNIARNAALTHYILVCDIEMYPSPDLPKKFLEMIYRNRSLSLKPKVYPLSMFEVDVNYEVPWNKTDLVNLLRMKKLIPFHAFICPGCHHLPKANEWESRIETDVLNVIDVVKRTGKLIAWEPIFIGTNNDPFYDERLSWEGKRDKMAQGYVLCVRDYEFHILDNAFLVHRPGIKKYLNDDVRRGYEQQSNEILEKYIYPELKHIYGERDGCGIH